MLWLDSDNRGGGIAMFRRTCAKASLVLVAGASLASCTTMGGDTGPQDRLFLPRLRNGAAVPAPNAQLTGVLSQDGPCLRVGGNGTTVIVWPRTANARAAPVGINVIVIWGRSATLQRSRVAGINGVVVWPRAIGQGTPVRVGERVALIGDMKDDILGLALDRPAPRGCAGPAFVVRDFAPAGAAEAE